MTTPMRQIRHSDASQESDEVQQLVAEIEPMFTPDEEVLYVAVQGHRTPTLQAVGAAMGIAKKEAVVATNTRLILYRPGLIGNARFLEIPWLEVERMNIHQGFFGTTFEVQRLTGRGAEEQQGPMEEIQYLEKDQAKRLFAVCQEIEKGTREERRQRRLEEERATTGGTNVVMHAPTALPTPTGDATAASSSAAMDPVAKLAKTKAMFDQGLISQVEYDTIRARILSAL